MDDIRLAQEKLQTFLNKTFAKNSVKDQLEDFKMYDFSELAQQQNCHEDSTDIAKAVYFLLWNNILPGMRTIEEMNNNYGGETINTFNTLFQEDLHGIEKFITREENPEFYKKVENFKKKYLTIGNFMLLPNKSSNNISLNQRKGSYNFRYKDYSDLFFVDLFNSNLLDDLKNANEFYFSKINETDFFKCNFLEDNVVNNKFVILFNHEKYDGKYYPYYHWKYKNPKEHKNEYILFANDYIDKVEKLIDNRANKIYQELEKHLL